MSRPVSISGERIDLVALTEDDAEMVHRWNCDMQLIYDWGGQPFPADRKTIAERLASQHKNRNSFILGIQTSDDKRLIGMGGLSHIEWPWQRAELTLAIGEGSDRGKGYGRDATMLVLDHAFTKLNLHSIMLRVISYNEQAIRCYESCGFTLSGRRRESRIDGEQFYDVLFMDILAGEYQAAKTAAD